MKSITVKFIQKLNFDAFDKQSSTWNIKLIVQGWLVVFYVASTTRSFRDGTPIYCPFQSNRILGCRLAVYYTTDALRQLRIVQGALRFKYPPVFCLKQQMLVKKENLDFLDRD